MENKTYKVVIYNYQSGEIASTIGTGLSEDKAEKRILTGLMRCNSDYGAKAICEQNGDVL